MNTKPLTMRTGVTVAVAVSVGRTRSPTVTARIGEIPWS